MPPFVPRKRNRSPSPAPASSSKRPKKSVFDALDAPAVNASSSDDKAFLDALGSDSSDTSDSDAVSDDFEDVQIGKSKKKATGKAAAVYKENGANDDEDDEDELDWEDALPAPTDTSARDSPPLKQAPWQRNQEDADDILEVSLGGPVEGNDEIARRNALGIKGPSKKDRQLRIWTHCMHVQLLLWHNHVRNGWVCNSEVQKILVDGLPDGVKIQVQQWRKDTGLPPDESLEPEPKSKGKKGANGTAKGKGKGKQRSDRHSDRNQRDWGGTADRMEEGVPNLSRGDPLHHLLKHLAAYWKKRFRITAPGLRKKGYFPTAKSLGAEIKAWQATKEDIIEQKKSDKQKKTAPDEYDVERFGERISSKGDFLEAARRCEGSRDAGAQLFTALIRGLGLEARMVASLQPIGFGFTKVEEVVLKKSQTIQPEAAKQEGQSVSNSEEKKPDETPASTKKPRQPAPKAQKPVHPNAGRPSDRKSGTRALPIEFDDNSDSSLSSAQSDISNLAVVGANPVSRPSNKHYDTDLKFPVYWTEVLSPISNTYVPVSPLVISTVASTPDLVTSFEPRGAAAEKAKQVICYVVAYSADGSAKDVTVRYLKKHIWPGKTKGFRMPIEKIPVYNKHGKVKRHEEFDWFKHVMSSYTRDGRLRTPADDLEDNSDLVPIKPSNANKATSGSTPDTLQGYKTSAEFVLERHLRREEALRADAKPVKTFITGKGDKTKPEPVFLRADVVACKSAESWHKEGRQLRADAAAPLKRVPMRAVTLVRKREVEEAERASGERALQGLYAREQTEWIVPPPIGPDGKIPRNAYGNIDVYVPSMVPRGAVHVPLRGAARVCKKLGIEFAEACTGFEFGRQMAVPVLTGVVVAEGNAQVVREAWREAEEAKRVKEERKRVEVALRMWRKFMLGLRVIERVEAEYGEGREEEINPFARRKREGEVGNTFERKFGDEFEDEFEEGVGGGEAGPGGFFRPGDEEEEVGEGGFVRDEGGGDASEGGFIREGDEDAMDGGGFIIEGDDRKEPQESQGYGHAAGAEDAPFSLQSAHQNLSRNDSDVAEDDSDDDEHEETRPVMKSTRGSTRGRGRGRGRRARSATTTAAMRGGTRRGAGKRKSLDADELDGTAEEESDSLSSALSGSESAAPAPVDDESASASDANPRNAKAVIEETPRRAPPRRAAARKSATAVRSHYFEAGDGGEEDKVQEDDGDDAEGVEEKPKPRSGRGGRGRGRGGGRGRAKP